jgi:hypothetical protein
MWIGRPLLTRSVAKIRRKSCGVNRAPANSGWVWASSPQTRRSSFSPGAGEALVQHADLVLEQERQGRAVLALVAVPATVQRDRSAVAGVVADDLGDDVEQLGRHRDHRSRSVLDGAITRSATTSPLGR